MDMRTRKWEIRMCDLLGLNFSHPINTKISLDLFQLRGKENPDGWGVAYYRENKLHVIKEPMPSIKSLLFDFVEDYPRTCTLISHVRRSTRGGKRYANTHPFYRELSIGSHVQEYAFAHNGTLQDVSSLTSDFYKPVGETDSERAFCYLLDTIRQRSIESWGSREFALIESLLQDMNTPDNTLNCLFSNGNMLFCYSDENDHNAGLRFLSLSKTSRSFELRDEDKQYGEVKVGTSLVDGIEEPNIQGVLVSTRRLGNHDWTEFRGGEMIVFKNGKMVYPFDKKNSRDL
ncbi:MAG: hypothetical protein GF309_11740 [Candidatus Lokiarchaeota archaeon]|nr:hypothetical protein [Candidatus Lokiarchaeota archaeon]